MSQQAEPNTDKTGQVDDQQHVQEGDAAGGAGGDNQQGQQDQGFDDTGLDERTRKYIADLRRENARYRTEAKSSKKELSTLSERFGTLEKGLKSALGIDDDESVDPADHIRALSVQGEELAFRNGLLEMALDNGLSGRARKVFELEVRERLEGADEELDDEGLQAIFDEAIAEAKAFQSGQPSGNVGAGGSGGKAAPPTDGSGRGEVTLEKFVAMTVTQKSQLYQQDKDTYNRLFAEAREKKLLK